jgi:hypothetical protein
MHVFIVFVCVQPAVLERGGVGKYVIECFFPRAARDRKVMRRYFIVTVAVERVNKNTEEICR